MPIVAELTGRAVQQIQSVFCAYPKVTRMICEDRADIVTAQRSRLLRIVTKDLDNPAVAVHPIEAAIAGPDPEGTAGIFEDPRELMATQGRRIGRLVLEMNECTAVG